MFSLTSRTSTETEQPNAARYSCGRAPSQVGNWLLAGHACHLKQAGQARKTVGNDRGFAHPLPFRSAPNAEAHP